MNTIKFEAFQSLASSTDELEPKPLFLLMLGDTDVADMLKNVQKARDKLVLFKALIKITQVSGFHFQDFIFEILKGSLHLIE